MERKEKSFPVFNSKAPDENIFSYVGRIIPVGKSVEKRGEKHNQAKDQNSGQA